MLVAFLLIPDIYILLFVAILGMLLSFLFSRQLHKANVWVFKKLANEDRVHDLEDTLPKGGPWDENLRAVPVHPLSIVVESTLFDLDLRNKFNVNVIFHQRGQRRIVAPAADTKLYPADILLLMGSNENLEQVEKLLTSDACLQRVDELQDSYAIHSVKIEPGSSWDGKSLSQLDLQANLRAVIVAIERQETPITNLNSSTVLQGQDLVWLAMDKSKLDQLLSLTSYSEKSSEI